MSNISQIFSVQIPGVLVLIDFFKSELRALTAVRSSVLTAGEDEKSVNKSLKTSLLFETMEILLLFSGSVLTASMREEIEICVGHGTYVQWKYVI